MRKKKTPIQLACEKQAKTNPCPKCRKSNIRNGIYLSICQHCGSSINISYLSAPWSMTWEQLQEQLDWFDQAFHSFGK